MDCQKCHTITNQEVKEILKSLKAPDAEILKVQVSPLKGLWEVSIINKGRPGLFYVDFSKNYVVSGSIVEVKTGKNKTMERMTKLQESRRVDFSKIPLNQALVMGDAASLPKGGGFYRPGLTLLRDTPSGDGEGCQERKDIVFYIILFPLPIHKDAYWKSKSILLQQIPKDARRCFCQKRNPQAGMRYQRD